MLYTNIQKFNDGIRLSGQTPLDDRIVIESIHDFFIGTNKTSHDLYGRAYNGLLVADAETGELYSCIDAGPYTPGNTSTVTADNYRTYWKQVGKELYDYVHGTVDPAIVRLDSSVDVLWDYSGRYKLTKISEPGEGIYSSYRLSFMPPGGSAYTDLTNTQIDIPEIQVVDEVHVCKATYNPETGQYENEKNQEDCTPEEWAAWPGEVYLHIIWDTKDDDGDPTDDKTAETYIKVSDMISVDITGLNTSVNLLEAYTQDTSNRLKQTTDDINASIIWNVGILNSSIQNSDASITAIKSDIATYKTQAAQALETAVDTLNGRIANVSTYAINVSNNLHSEMASMKQYVDDTSTLLGTMITNKTDDVSTVANNKINAVQSNLDALSAQHTQDVQTINSHLRTLDTSVSYFVSELQETELTVAAELQRCEDARIDIINCLEDVSTQEQVMAAALNRIDASYIALDASVKVLWGERSQNMSASPMAASTRSAAKSVQTIDTIPKTVEIEMSELFAYNDSDQVNVDMRAVSVADSLYINKNNVNVPVSQTFREDSDNVIYYYDFIDSVGFRRKMVEVGMNEESNFVVIANKTITLTKMK